jgi:hypothetical protein
MSKETPEFWIELVGTEGFDVAAQIAAETETTIRVYTEERTEFAAEAAKQLHHALAALGSDPVQRDVTQPSAESDQSAAIETTQTNSFEVELVGS